MGEISIGNQRMGPSPSNWQAARQQMGIVFQEPALLDELPVWENIGLRLLETGTNPHTVQEEVQAALASVGLQSEVATLYPAALSGGMQKRVAFARAVLHQPKILFADEPAAGLDPQNATRMDELMLQLASRPNRLSILVTHDPISVQAFASHVLMLEKGLLHFKGPVAEFLACPTPSIVAFLKRHLQHSS
jgi:phospholipid/cholesterol/gamma-HCH transport system ATP-binding protein